jgi:hypothetical protein
VGTKLLLLLFLGKGIIIEARGTGKASGMLSNL